MRKTMYVLFAAVLALMSLVGTASATGGKAEIELAAPGVEVGAPAQDVSALALSCDSGDLCVWPVSDGSNSRCSWGGADSDWQGGSVRCSWSGSRAVQAAYNNGQNTSYTRVCLYPGANYTGGVAYYVYRGQQISSWPGVKIRSHKWVTGNSCW